MSPILQSLANGSARGYGAFVPLGAAGAYESIASATGTGSSGTITFSSIPSTYQSLQIRGIAITSAAARLRMRVNSDTGANYAMHYLVGYGSGVNAGGNSSNDFVGVFSNTNTSTTYPTAFIVDIHNYASTSQNKTIRILSGMEENSTTGEIDLDSGLWINTSAISSLTFYLSTGNFTTSTQLALYGIKGA